MEKINSLTGMLDLISNKSDKSELANKIFLTEKHLKNIFQNYGMSEIRTPALEDTNLFKRSVGDASDIVNKELYSFNDKNDKNIVLRPEGTAGVIRAIIQKKIDLEIHKFWYMGLCGGMRDLRKEDIDNFIKQVLKFLVIMRVCLNLK